MSTITMYALLACLCTWGATAIGAATIFFVRKFNQKVMDAMLGFAAGVMIAASFFSLIIPALDFATLYNPGINKMVIVAGGFICGAGFLLLLDIITPHLHFFEDSPEGPKTDLRRSVLLLLAITIHNIPEGLAVGVAFGAFNIMSDGAHSAELLSAAIALMVGIAIQNVPEGAAVSFPLHREGLSKIKAFMYGQASALVEPLGIIIGINLIRFIQPILPFALSFAAGAMIFVVVEELIPEAQKNNNANLATIFTILGLVVMMVLDVTLG